MSSCLFNRRNDKRPGADAHEATDRGQRRPRRGGRANRDLRLTWSPARDVRTEPSASELASSGLRRDRVYSIITVSRNPDSHRGEGIKEMALPLLTALGVPSNIGRALQR